MVEGICANEVRTAVINRLQMLLAEVTDSISLGPDANVIDHILECSEGLYRYL